MSNYTKGPWESRLDTGWGWVVKAGRKFIAWKLDESNARLIAAAPEMAEILLRFADRGMGVTAEREIRELLNKAGVIE